MGKYEEASDILIKGLQLEPDNQPLHQKLMEAYDAIKLQSRYHFKLSPRDFRENKTVDTIQKYLRRLSDLAMPLKCIQVYNRTTLRNIIFQKSNYLLINCTR